MVALVVTFVTMTVIGAPAFVTGVALPGVPVASSTSQLNVDGEGALPSLEQTAFGNVLTSLVPVLNGLVVVQFGTLPRPLCTVLTKVIPEKTGALEIVTVLLVETPVFPAASDWDARNA